MPSPGVDLATAVALAAGGVVSAARLRAEGADPRVADRLVRRGAWQRPARGVYAARSGELGRLELAQAAAALAGAPVVVSGLVALHELGPLRWLPDSPRVLALVDPAVRTPSSGRVVLRRTRDVDELDTWQRGGVTWAPPSRAVLDAARQAGTLRDVRGIVLGAVADGWVGTDDLLRELSTTQRNGSGAARRAVRDAVRGCASPPEAELVDALVGCGRPFLVNPRLVLHGRLLGSPDVWLVGTGVGGEVESVERHGSGVDVGSTYDRHESWADRGVSLVHLSVRRIRRDVREAAAHLLRRAAAGPGDPPGLAVVPRGPLLR